ncbi:UDP-glucuronosyltransferase 2B20-like [Pollicipes pollicipes]|uniref:UDP-glucuronosyltransferase 2B20-like n=1 Tax=Pollicipes pollicipes TaxID=41117 RepID=UPI00188532CA|nr:UDP-glucuronosyltransferase 2B20-like [Pollicipes pollicipes]
MARRPSLLLPLLLRVPLLLPLLVSSAAGPGTRLLILHPLYPGSHELVLRSLGERLAAEHGFNVTQVRWLSDRSPPVPANSSVEVLTRTVEGSALTGGLVDEAGRFLVPGAHLWRRATFPAAFVATLGPHCADLLGDRRLLARLRRRRFDVALVDFVCNECGLLLAAALRLPTVGFWGMRFAGPDIVPTQALNLPAVTPTAFSGLPPVMTFVQRLRNAAQVVADRLLATLRGGIPARPLSDELERFMQSSGEHGVVLFSLGMTAFDPDAVPQQFVDAFVSAFSRLRQKVLMRFSAARVAQIPSNVKIVDWLPQVDVLGHPKTRAFVTQCGIGSAMEAVYNGVPMLAVPIFVDQHENALFLQHRGLAIAVDRFNISTSLLETSLQRLLYTPSFRLKTRRAAAMWSRDPSAATERAAYWLQLAAGFGSLEPFHLMDGHLSWAQFWLLDVVAVVAVAMVTALVGLCFCCRRCCRRRAMGTYTKGIGKKANS